MTAWQASNIANVDDDEGCALFHGDKLETIKGKIYYICVCVCICLVRFNGSLV